MGLSFNSSKWKKVQRLVTVISAQLVLFFLLNLNPVYAMPGQSEDLNGIQECISFNVPATNIPVEVDRLCGQLIILKDLKFEKYYIGLQVCDGGNILIFQTRPRELLKFYQLREPKIGKGAKISTELGDFNQYITTFKSYIPISSCSECGKILSPTPRELIGTPEGTQSLVFPTATIGLPTATFTRTPVPTPTFTSPSPTLQPTKAGFTATATLTKTFTPLASATIATPTIEKTPPGENPSELPDNSRCIFSGVAVAFIFTLGVGFFYLRRKLR
jgi:hypothetical protein